jgi:uncharacterized membrane protein YcfT
MSHPYGRNFPAANDDATSPVGVAHTDRLPWVDVAKAGAIILVVLFHVAGAGVAFLLPNAQDFWLSAWKAVSAFLVPVRMPLFFLMSGLLAASAVFRPWRLLLRSRYATLLWPYLLWSLAFSVVYGFAIAGEKPFPTIQASLVTIGFGGNAYWFLTTLVVLFTLARVFARWGTALVFLSFASWLAVPLIQPVLDAYLPTDLATNVGRWSTFALWFFLGCFASRAVHRVAALPLFPLLPLATAGYCAMVWFYYVLGNRDIPWTIGLNVAGLLTAVQLSVLLARNGWVASVGRGIAGRTLPIYLLHPMIIYAVVAISEISGNPVRLPTDSRVVNAIFVPLVTALLVWASMALYDAAMRSPLHVVFVPPRLRFPRRHRPEDAVAESDSARI